MEESIQNVVVEIGSHSNSDDEAIKESKPKVKWSKYEKKFKMKWQEDPKLEGWVEPHSEDIGKASCKYCRCILRAHKADLYKHSETRKHKKNSINVLKTTITSHTKRSKDNNTDSSVPRKNRKKVKVEKMMAADGSYFILQSEQDIFTASTVNENIFVDYNSDSVQPGEGQQQTSESFSVSPHSEDSKIGEVASRVGSILAAEVEKILRSQKSILKMFRDDGELSLTQSNVREISKICIGHLAQRYLVESAIEARGKSKGNVTGERINISTKFRAIEEKLEKTMTEMRDLKASLNVSSDASPFSQIDLGDLLKNA